MSEKQRFGGIARLYGNSDFEKLQRAHFCIIGIGGVGSWSAEALARSGVGKITVIDLDDVCTTNINRQVHALTDTVGKSKVEVMQQRIAAISPSCLVHTIEDFVTPDNVFEYLSSEFDCIIEATDSVKAKAAIIAWCKRNKMDVITVGGAGGQIDPRLITSGDLAKTTQDPLSAKLRSELRRFYNFSKNPKRRFGIECVYSIEQLRYPQPDGTVGFNKSRMDGSTRLDCASGFGASAMVTASFGMVAASRAVSKFLTNKKS